MASFAAQHGRGINGLWMDLQPLWPVLHCLPSSPFDGSESHPAAPTPSTQCQIHTHKPSRHLSPLTLLSRHANVASGVLLLMQYFALSPLHLYSLWLSPSRRSTEPSIRTDGRTDAHANAQRLRSTPKWSTVDLAQCRQCREDERQDERQGWGWGGTAGLPNIRLHACNLLSSSGIHQVWN